MSAAAEPSKVLTAVEMAQGYRHGALMPEAVMQACLSRIAEANPILNCFCDVYADEALEEAQASAKRFKAGRPLGALDGVPVAIKDLTPIAGKRTTLGSKAFADNIAERDAVIVERLRAEGAIIVGKTTLPEFAYSSFTSSPLLGITRNPWDPSKTPGGSSGGAGAAVASGCVPLAEGSDMGGSIRIPASWCGTVGLTPSLGRIPFDYLPSQFDNLSHLGPLARSIDDAALFLAATQGTDSRDIFSLPGRLDLSNLPRDVGGLRLAASVDLGFYAIDPAVAAAFQESLSAFEAAGALIEPVELPWSRDLVTAWYDLWGAFMEGFFGDLLPQWESEMDPNVVDLIKLGQSLPASRIKDIDILRTEMWNSLAPVLERCDALLCPTCSNVAPDVSDSDAAYDELDASGKYRGLDMTAVFNLISPCPVLSVPNGMAPNGLPTALQIVGRRHDEVTALRIGAQLEDLRGGFPLAPWPIRAG